MAGTPQPLDQKFPIVGPDGRPTDYFTRWAQQRQLDISGGLTLADLQAYLLAHKLIEGSGIQFSPASGNIDDHLTIAADVQEILDQLSATRGTIIYRGLTGWTVLLPGTSGQFLKTNGAGADPVWAAAGGGGSGSTPVLRGFTAAIGYNASSFNIPFPAGTVAGDIVVAWLENGFNGQTGVPSQSGWTTITAQNNGFTNGSCCAKVVAAADIAIGFVTLSAGGAFNGVAGAVAIQGSTVSTYEKDASLGTPNTSIASITATGLSGVNPLDLVVAFVSSRGATNITVGANMTLLGALATSGGNAIGGVCQVAPAALGKLGMAETLNFTGGNNGVFYSFLAFKGP